MKKRFQIPVGTATYTVRLVKDLHLEGNKVYGYTHSKDKVIAVEADLQPALRLHTFLHEYFHAALHEHVVFELPPEIEERVVESLSHAFVATLLRSKAFKDLFKI